MNQPTRLPLIADDTPDELLQEIFDRTRSGFGDVPNLYRTLGHASRLLNGWISFAWALRNDAESPRSLRELVILRVAGELGSDYEQGHHVPMALAAGCTQAQVDGLGDWRDHADLYGPEVRSALAVADRTVVGEAITEAEWSDLAAHFDHGACVEIVLTAAFYVCVARVLDGLAVPPESH